MTTHMNVAIREFMNNYKRIANNIFFPTMSLTFSFLLRRIYASLTLST